MPMNTQFSGKWLNAAESLDIPPDDYNPQIRILSNQLQSSSYEFGIIYNPSRSKRPTSKDVQGCMLCGAVKQAVLNPDRIIHQTDNFIMTPNLYPTVKGSSIAFSRWTGSQEMPMFRTPNLKGVQVILQEYFGIARATGLQITRNSPGAGASIPEHEHCNYHDFSQAYEIAGQSYGFDASEISPTPIRGVSTMPDFPFANLVFEEDPDTITDFLAILNQKIGHHFQDQGVPHGISQGPSGILVVPAKKYVEGKGTGAGDMMGHLLCGSQQEFQDADWDYCTNRLGKTLFGKDEINLANLL